MRTIHAVIPAALASAALLVAPLTLTGCVSGKSSVRVEGRYVGDETLDKIVPGDTTKEWILAVLGPPTERSVLSNGLEIWKWGFRQVEVSRGGVFLIARGRSSHESVRNAFVEFEGDVVSRAWRD